jgi:hypothetical protein
VTGVRPQGVPETPTEYAAMDIDEPARSRGISPALRDGTLLAG